MSDANIPALLEELREVDLETYVCFLRLKSASRGEIQDIEAMELIDHDIIQDCIQRARPDHWIISQWMSQDKWQAMIRRGPRGYTDPEYMHIGEGDTPAAAILAAYIEAVRARQ